MIKLKNILNEGKEDFKPHMMYDPKTGKGYMANKYEDHVRMDKMGYVHEKPENVNEGPSTEEKRIAMLAVRKQAKYRNVDMASAIQDQINALMDLQRDVKRGKKIK